MSGAILLNGQPKANFPGPQRLLDQAAYGGEQQRPTVADVLTYVLKSTGNDSSGVGTSGSPLLTVGGALARAALELAGRRLLIDMTNYGATYAPNVTDFFPTLRGGQFGGSDALSVVDPDFGVRPLSDVEIYARPNTALALSFGTYIQAALAPHYTTVQKIGAGWTVDQFKDFIIVDPTGTGQSGVILSNTADTLVTTLNGGFGAFANLAILSPSTTIDLSNAFAFLGGGAMDCDRGGDLAVQLTGLAFVGDGLASYGTNFCHLTLFGCQPQGMFSNDDKVELFACACTSITGNNFIQTNPRGFFIYNSVMRKQEFGIVNTYGKILTYLSDFDGCDPPGLGVFHGFGSSNRGPIDAYGVTIHGSNQGLRIIGTKDNQLQDCDISNCDIGLILERGAEVSINGTLTGTGNGNTGVWLQQNSHLFLGRDNVVTVWPTITGTDGDLHVGGDDNAASIPWSIAQQLHQVGDIHGDGSALYDLHFTTQSYDTNWRVAVGNEAFPQYALLKLSSAVAGRYETVKPTDDAQLAIAVAFTACSGAGAKFAVLTLATASLATTLLSDGTALILVGAPITSSGTVAGRVMAAGALIGVIGFNDGAQVPMVPDSPVSVL